MDGPLLLVGCGKMGGALTRGWRAQGVAADQILVIEPQAAAAQSARAAGVPVIADAGLIPAKFQPRVIVLAVKPQVMAEAIAPYRRFAEKAGFLSIAAGRTLASFSALLGPSAAVVRAMPNTPAAIGRGITVACANANVDRNLRALCHDLLTAVGEAAWVEDERLLDAVTALSGSGPAYVFLLIEALAEAGVSQGLPPELSAQLALATVAGSGELARQSDARPAQLRADVTSPGGTTEAALQVLLADDGLKPLLARAISAATRRSRELSS